MTELASVVKHFPRPSETYTDNLSSSISAGAVTVPVNSASAYDDGDIAVIMVDAGTANEAVFTGEKASSPERFINCVWTEGNVGVGHSNGATLVDYVSSTHVGMISKGILVAHNQDGTLKDGAVDNAAALGNDVVTAAAVDWASTGANGGIWWEELGRTTATGGSTASLAVSVPARKYYKIMAVFEQSNSGTRYVKIHVNGDTGSNYYNIGSVKQASTAAFDQDALITNLGECYISAAGGSGYIETTVSRANSGVWLNFITHSGGANYYKTASGRWQSTAAITSFELNPAGATWVAGSEIVVLGHN